uniref:Reverse transcriptase domain-containing protein n=1 Tax=Scophthalmus maximus TaxID=52904 RepID=A0A8D3EEN3_SCOMX
MQGGKAPGIDGLPPEFYKTFWEELKTDIMDVFTESFGDCSLPQSCRRAVLTLLPKKGDLMDITNWRPVSLPCSDYKLLSKVLSSRLKKVMDPVIHRTQTHCVPGRSIVDNVSLVRYLLTVSGSLGLDAGLVSLDQEKAFDRVEHHYLWKVLGLSPGFIAKIKVMYENIESVLKINRGLCEPFKVTRGIRQGCSMLGMLYALSIEPMLHNVRSSINGLVLPGFDTPFTVSAYADDIIAFTKGQNDVDSLGHIVEAFQKISEAKVNWAKSDALAVGKWAGGLPQLPGGLAWQRGGLKYLGVYLGDQGTTAMNWEGVVGKVEGKLNKWRWLLPHMSYRGRVLIINNLVASSLWHKLKCMEPPAGLLKSIQSIILKFFWDDLHWTPQCVLYLPKEEGGQGLVDLVSRTAAFILQFVQRFLFGTDDVVWRPVASTILRGVAGLGLDASLFLVDCGFVPLCKLPHFYQGLFTAWRLFKWSRLGPAASLFWLLEEPLVWGARLDLHDGSRPGLTDRLTGAGVKKLGGIVEAAGPCLQNTEAVASLLGLRSARHTRTILNEWNNRLDSEEKEMLQDYSDGTEAPDSGDPFPDIFFFSTSC